MSHTEPKPQTVGRAEAIDLLRTELLKHTDCETSACKFAADSGAFCHGFSRFGKYELRRKYAWITRRRPNMSREELEEIANRWQLARQDVRELPTACDVQQQAHEMCNGWDDFSNEELGHFYAELTGRKVLVA